MTGQYPCQLLHLNHLLGKKWTLPLLFLFEKASLSFNQLKKQTHNKINATLLSETLKQLETHRIIAKNANGTTHYDLTPQGRSLLTILTSLKAWAQKNDYLVGKDCAQKSCMDCGYFIQ